MSTLQIKDVYKRQEVLYAREAKDQENPAQFLAEKEAEYTKLFANPYNAATYLFLAEVGTSAGKNLVATFQESGLLLFGVGAVSYTHLDVYKRQPLQWWISLITGTIITVTAN